MNDPYLILGVGESATTEEIRAAFREKAEKTDAEKFREIAEAYAILSDPRKRREYDATQTISMYTYYDAVVNASYMEQVIAQFKQVLTPYRHAAAKARISGIVWLAIGLAILVGMFAADTDGAGFFAILLLVIIFGAIRATRGFLKYSEINDMVGNVEQEMWESLG